MKHQHWLVETPINPPSEDYSHSRAWGHRVLEKVPLLRLAAGLIHGNSQPRNHSRIRMGFRGLRWSRQRLAF